MKVNAQWPTYRHSQNCASPRSRWPHATGMSATGSATWRRDRSISRRYCCCMASARTRWRYQLAGLADRFRLIAWNAPGYLLSDNLRAETPSCRDYADALDDLLSALGIDRFDIVANSFGTRVAQCFACYRPGRIGRAVFTGTSIPHSTLPEERMQSVEARARMIERGGYSFGDRAAALLGSAATVDTLVLVQQTLRATNPAGFMQAARFIAAAEMPLLAAGLTMPVLMIQGEEDRVTPAAMNAEPCHTLVSSCLPAAATWLSGLPPTRLRPGSTWSPASS